MFYLTFKHSLLWYRGNLCNWLTFGLLLRALNNVNIPPCRIEISRSNVPFTIMSCRLAQMSVILNLLFTCLSRQNFFIQCDISHMSMSVIVTCISLFFTFCTLLVFLEVLINGEDWRNTKHSVLLFCYKLFSRFCSYTSYFIII